MFFPTGSRPPQGTYLHYLVTTYFPDYLEELRGEGRELPDFVLTDVQEFLSCGDIKTRYATLECLQCTTRRNICLRCKRRGWCPPCMEFRQMDRTRFVQQRVIGDTPIRQWVLTLPPPLRIYLAFHPRLVTMVLRQFLTFIFQQLAKAAKKCLRKRGITAKVRFLKAGAVTAIQRFSTDLSLNLHFHSLVTDGVFVKLPTDDSPWFLEISVSSKDVAEVAMKICRWTCNLLKRDGRWEAVHEASNTNFPTVTGHLTLGDNPPALHRFCGVASDQETDRPVGRDGIYAFNVYARDSVRRGDRKNLRRLIRYILSPPFTNEQLRPDPDSANHLFVDLKRPMLDGTETIRLTLRQFFNRLVWATPRPRANLLRFHGVYASNAALREEVVPAELPAPAPAPSPDDGPDDYEAWGELQSHTFPSNLRRCHRCGGRMKLVALKSDRILYRRRSGKPPDDPEKAASSIIYLHKAARRAATDGRQPA